MSLLTTIWSYEHVSNVLLTTSSATTPSCCAVATRWHGHDTDPRVHKPSHRLLQLTAVQNAAECLTGTTRQQHITPVFRQLHWLPVRKRTCFKLLGFVFQVLRLMAPVYLVDDVSCCRLVIGVNCALPPREHVQFHVSHSQLLFTLFTVPSASSLAGVSASPNSVEFSRKRA